MNPGKRIVFEQIPDGGQAGDGVSGRQAAGKNAGRNCTGLLSLRDPDTRGVAGPPVMQRLAILLVAMLCGFDFATAATPAETPAKPVVDAKNSVAKTDGTKTDGAKVERTEAAFFEQHVRPLLVQHCYECHSSKAQIVQGGLLLDSKPGWQKGGDSGPAIVPGQPEKSLLVRALGYADEDVQMPPKGKLGDKEIALVSEWVRRGAPDPRITAEAAPAAKRTLDLSAGRKHWAFQPLARAQPPQLSTSNWCRTVVDRFILDQQQRAKVQPNALADRRTLIRRAYFDLLGLPPDPDEIESFVNDTSADAYPRLVDRLLASPHFGERWARHWLDLARWAESHGFEQDYDRPYAYAYRDFVIKAMNQDLPYDKFVQWQLAGDEFEPENPLALAATGFLAAGVHATQITANQAEKERYDELDDMARTTGTAMLGLTIGCARCHDHKFDPVSNEDYYRVVSTFTTTVRSNRLINTDAAGYRRQLAAFQERHRPVAAALEKYERDELTARFDEWLAAKEKPRPAPRWIVLDTLKVNSGSTAKFARLDDGSYLASNFTPHLRNTCTITAEIPAGIVHALRLEALPDDSLPGGGPGQEDAGAFNLKTLKVVVAAKDKKKGEAEIRFAGRWTSGASHRSDGTASEGTVDKNAGLEWNVPRPAGQTHVAVWKIDKPVSRSGPSAATLTMGFGSASQEIGRLRLAVSLQEGPLDATGGEISQTALQAWPSAGKPAKLSAGQRQALFHEFRTQDARWQELNADVKQSLAQRPRPHLQWMMYSSEGVPAVRLHTQGPDFYEKTYQLKRGDPNQKLSEIKSGFVEVLLRPGTSESRWRKPPPAQCHTSYRRRALANWITDCDGGAGNLLARVIVNRLWQHHVGRGIVATPSDFGMAGEKPTHPELLDYLAGELVRGGWRLKPIHKLIMSSAVYMQTAEVDAARLKADLDNRLFWHREPQRLEAETVRDAMLAASGTLDRTLFGPGTLDADHHRRSIYFFVKRSQLVPMMMLFDAPDTLQDLAVRSETTVAPQALLLLNNTVVRQYAEALAGRVMPSKTGSANSSIARAYATALGREPTPEELKATADFLAVQEQAYRDEHRDQPAAMAWGDFCQVLLGMNEFIFVR
jgi:hypothetical protein